MRWNSCLMVATQWKIGRKIIFLTRESTKVQVLRGKSKSTHAFISSKKERVISWRARKFSLLEWRGWKWRLVISGVEWALMWMSECGVISRKRWLSQCSRDKVMRRRRRSLARSHDILFYKSNNNDKNCVTLCMLGARCHWCVLFSLSLTATRFWYHVRLVFFSFYSSRGTICSAAHYEMLFARCSTRCWLGRIWAHSDGKKTFNGEFGHLVRSPLSRHERRAG